jgi:hypothetical protein
MTTPSHTVWSGSWQRASKAASVGGPLVALWLSEFGAGPLPTPVAGFENHSGLF